MGSAVLTLQLQGGAGGQSAHPALLLSNTDNEPCESMEYDLLTDHNDLPANQPQTQSFPAQVGIQILY
jgi:hypothetical protein